MARFRGLGDGLHEARSLKNGAEDGTIAMTELFGLSQDDGIVDVYPNGDPKRPQ